MEPSYDGDYAAAPGSYDYADDMAAGEAESAPESALAPAPSMDAPSGGPRAAEAASGGDGVGGMAMRDEAPPSPSPAKSKASRGADKKGEGASMRERPPEEAKIAAEHDRDRRDRNIQSGTLTAGSFDDNLNPWVFNTFVDQARSQPDLSRLASAFGTQRTVLRVQDVHGRPVGNAKVEIDGKHMMTRSDGRVVWVQGWDSGSQGQGKAKISHGNANATVSINNQIEQLVTLKDTQGTLPDQLDIALVIDATGSMGDELEFLKVEIRDIAAAIEHHFPGVDQRFALIVYRDTGDQYTTRVFDFTGNLGRFQKDLGAQSANGGGDYPEAMDAALIAAEKLSWRNGDTARVTFLVADAPPHADKVDDTLDAVDGLRSMGVAVYPVASSGVAGEAEFVMRAAALLTGAQYLFLTDDSGVGNPHAEPHIPCYTVEQLAPLMVRAVRSELAGHRVEAEPQFSIRTVGEGQNGVCSQQRRPTKIAK
ncbi:hypothetical protein DB30_03686 [Enhygromyxa salina]|uniref:VWFA domain-containing protein n=2 Tax=Enhygromyxa salina TaxID=215803 RepID=A0A0C1ZHK9_9BACT|nr:hypothetical protein DB30_03686 [Enhygromyxa salina]